MRYADISDTAAEVALLDTENALKNHQAKLTKRVYSEYCEKCGESIPMERQKATGGTDICVDCLAEFERTKHAY